MIAEKDYSFVIDTSPPSAPIVNATSPVCGSTVSAVFFANDSVSSVDSYIWKFGHTANPNMANGSTSDTSISISSSNNGSALQLAADMIYYFSVKAVDGAGNVGAEASSNKILFDESGLSCDTTPPAVTLTKSNDSRSALLDCIDEQSGCDSLNSLYGTSYTKSCNATQYFLIPRTLLYLVQQLFVG